MSTWRAWRILDGEGTAKDSRSRRTKAQKRMNRSQRGLGGDWRTEASRRAASLPPLSPASCKPDGYQFSDSLRALASCFAAWHLTLPLHILFTRQCRAECPDSGPHACLLAVQGLLGPLMSAFNRRIQRTEKLVR